jgi:hypothetical protein
MHFAVIGDLNCIATYRYPILISNGVLVNAGDLLIAVSGKVAPNGAITVTVSHGDTADQPTFRSGSTWGATDLHAPPEPRSGARSSSLSIDSRARGAPSPLPEFGLGAGAAAAAPDSMVWSAAPGERSEVRGQSPNTRH